jgi:uncharacterized membrane protein
MTTTTAISEPRPGVRGRSPCGWSTTTLRAAFRAPATRQNQADRRVLLLRTILFGAVAEFVALAALFNDQRVLVAVAAYLLFAALGFNLGVAAVGLHKAMTQPED